MDLAFALARAEDADLVLANDPDADRVAVGVPDRSAPGGWRRLSGNEVGLLLGWRAARTHEEGTLACSLVSSPGLGVIARHYGLGFAETLTGFKWISRAPHLAFGYEEALGYLVDPEKVRDKDGISAAVLIADLVADLAADGRTLGGALDDLAARFGVHVTGQVSRRFDDLDEIGRAMARLREYPPAELAGIGVTARDLAAARGPLRTDAVTLTGPGLHVTVRPSGTEPKLKAYFEVVEPVTSTTHLAAARVAAQARAEAVRAHLAAGDRPGTS